MIPDEHQANERTKSKPRASGDDPETPTERPERWTVNPARAGMIPWIRPWRRLRRRKPRASGDDPALDVMRELIAL